MVWEATRGFSWRDGERLVRYGLGTRHEVVTLLTALRLTPFVLLTTPRWEGVLAPLEEAATGTVLVPGDQVPVAASAVRDELVRAGTTGLALVALGGGRVIDVAKALAAAAGVSCAAVPTTLSGAEMTSFHRPLAGAPPAAGVRPALVVSDPALAAGQPAAARAASAMNALGHAMEALYAPGASPVSELAARRGAALIARGLPVGEVGAGGGEGEEGAEGERAALALGALLAGYAFGATGVSLHHLVCQSIVRTAGTPHAETNAVMLPHTAALMARREPAALGAFAAALGARGPDPAQAVSRLRLHAAATGVARLADLGLARSLLAEIATVAASRPELATVAPPPGREELLALLETAY